MLSMNFNRFSCRRNSGEGIHTIWNDEEFFALPHQSLCVTAFYFFINLNSLNSFGSLSSFKYHYVFFFWCLMKWNQPKNCPSLSSLSIQKYFFYMILFFLKSTNSFSFRDLNFYFILAYIIPTLSRLYRDP
jgi:hypothetical protein